MGLKQDGIQMIPKVSPLYIEKKKISEKIRELEEEKKQELIGTKGQDRYYIKQKYNNKIEILKELLEEDKR